MYTGRVACCPYSESRWLRAERFIKVRKTGQTDGRTLDRYITLSATRSERNNAVSSRL